MPFLLNQGFIKQWSLIHWRQLLLRWWKKYRGNKSKNKYRAEEESSDKFVFINLEKRASACLPGGYSSRILGHKSCADQREWVYLGQPNRPATSVPQHRTLHVYTVEQRKRRRRPPERVVSLNSERTMKNELSSFRPDVLWVCVSNFMHG